MDDQSKKAVELVQGMSKQLIGLAAFIVTFSVGFAERFNRSENEWTLIAAWSASVLSMIVGVWMLLALTRDPRAAAPVESDADDLASSSWILGWNVRFPLFLQAVLFVAGVGLLAGGGVVRKPAQELTTVPATAPNPLEDFATRLARMEKQFEERRTLTDDQNLASRVAAERMCESMDKLTLEVGSVERALIEQISTMNKQQRQIAVAAVRQHGSDIERADTKFECETMGSILGSLRTIMKANLADAESIADRQFWTLYSGPFLLVRTPALIRGVDECAVMVRELEEGPVLNAKLQAKLTEKVTLLASQCRNRFRESEPTGEDSSKN